MGHRYCWLGVAGLVSVEWGACGESIGGGVWISSVACGKSGLSLAEFGATDLRSGAREYHQQSAANQDYHQRITVQQGYR